MTFDMGKTWSRGIELMRDNFQLLVVIAGVFILLPTVATALFMPDYSEFFAMMLDPSTDPDKLSEQFAQIAGPLFGFILVGLAFQFAGNGGMVTLMGGARPTVGEAVKRGLQILPSLIAIMAIGLVAIFVGLIAIAVPIAMLAGPTGSPMLSLISLLLMGGLLLFIFARLSMTLPVLAYEDTLNPFKAVARSLALTKKFQWPIMVFWSLINIIIFVITLLVSGVIEVVAAIAGPGTVGLLISGGTNGIVAMINAMITCGLAAAMYNQLAGPSQTEIADTFR